MAKGTIAALDAPWPYVIVRPVITGLQGNYSLVHGVVNSSGRFEQLTLLIPDQAATKQILPALL